MKKKTIGKQILAWVLAGAMMPQTSIAYAAETAASTLGPKEDILVRWIPEKDQVKAGEEGKVTLEARLNTKKSKVDRAEIEIHLEPEEAEALQLEVFDNAEEAVDWNDDGSADLYFELDSENKKLRQKLTFVVPEDVEELFDIDVDRDDITVTPYGEFDEEDGADDADMTDVGSISGVIVATQTNAADTVTTDETITDASVTDTTMATATPTDSTDADSREKPSIATPSTATSSNGSDDTRTDVEIDEGVKIRIETRILHVIGEVPEYDLSVTTVDLTGDEEADCFQFQVDAVKQEDSSALAVKEQSLSMKLELPEWISMPQQNAIWNEENNRLQIDGTDLAEITGIPDSMDVTSVKVSDPQTLEVQLEKAETNAVEIDPEEEQMEDIANYGENADIHLTVALFHTSPLLQVSEDAKTAVENGESAEAIEGQIVLSAVLTTTAAGLATEDEDSAAKDIKLSDLLKDEAVADITQTTSFNKQLFWIDNQNESNIRPTTPEKYLQRFKPAITFQVEGETEQIAFTQENWRKYFGNAAMPQLQVANNLGQISLNDVPTQATWTSPYDGISKTCSITWTMKQTNLEDMGEDEKPNYLGKYSISSVDTETNGRKEGWYYIERRTLDFDIDMRIGSLIPEDPEEQTKFWEELYTSLRNVFGKRYTFYMETSLGLRNYPFEDVLNGRNSTFDPGTTTFHFSLGAMWKYDLSGIPVVYYLKDNGTKGEADKITSGELRGNDGQPMLGDRSDYLEAIYNNSQVGNFGSKTDALYGGGTMLLQLRGTRGYKATKKWADEADPNNRPDGELQLWRYRDGEDFNEAAPVRDKNGDILTIALEKDPTKNSQEIVFKDSDGNPIELDKYDPEGYNYRYVVKEYLDGSNASSYEQVFGDIENEKIKDQIEGVKTTRPYPDQRSGTNAGNTWLYDGGVLTNRLNKRVNVTGVKVWQAATFQDDLKDTVVTMTLYYRRKNGLDWSKVNDPVVTATLTDFRAENEGKMTVTRSMPLYDEEGYELEYRWFETNVEQGTMETEFAEVPDTIQGGNEQTADRMFALEHRGNMVPYESENTYDENTGVSTVYNRVVDTRDYIIEKQWNGVDPKEISFYLYRTIGGLKNEQLGSFTFTKDGSLKDFSLDGMIAAELLTKWQVKLENLPRYDSKGYTYEYFLSESNDVNSIPTYNMTVDPDGTLRTLIVNGPVGTGHSILIRKNWIDDGDTVHRNLVTIRVYDKQTNEQIGDDVVIGDNEIWMKQVNIGEHNPGNVYIVEKQVGEYDALTDENGESITKEESQTPGLQAYRTGEHLYRVSYSHSTTGSGEQNHDIYTVSNRRIGTIDITLTKNWLDGDRTKRAALANAVEKINQQANDDPLKEIHWILKLGFDAVPDTSEYPEISGNYDYQVTMTKTGGDTVTINQDGAQQIYQTKTEGGYANPGQSWYDLLETNTLPDTSQVYHFFHIPKYDYAGDVINYRVLELWVDGNGNPVTNPGMYSYVDDGKTKYLNALLMDYQAFSSLNTYDVGQQHTNDQQAIGITNQLSSTRTLHWHKQWHDNYNYNSNLRPDIYLDIYRKSNAPGSTLEKYESDYRWIYQNSTVHPDSSISKRHRWTVNIYDVDRYDAKGYEWRYYAREKTKVDKSQFDYTAVLYSIDGIDPSAETELGTELVPTEEAKTGDYVEQIDNSEEYALVEEGTFTNAIAGNVVIDGQKVWHNLPQTYLADPNSTLPQAVFYIDQKVDTLDEVGQVPVIQIRENVAKLPITDWNQIKDKNEYYKFGLRYLGNYTVDDWGIHAPMEDEEHLIPRYNERGNLYEYSVREEMQWNTNDSWPNGVKRGDVQNVYTTTIQTYLVTNSYDSVKGALRIKKYLSLPANMDASKCPAVSMVLTRSYWTPDGTANGKIVKDDTFQKEQTWNAADIKNAFAAAKTGNEDASSAILLDSTAQEKDPFLFEDLDIYAPNGAEYIYQVEEKKESYLGGYDTWGSSGDKDASDDSANGVKLGVYKNINVIGDLSPTWNLANSDQENGRGKTDPSTPVAATYFNELQSVKETVMITGTKQWDEYTFQTGKRPIADDFSKWLELDRSAKSQPGQNNAISAEKVEGAVFNVTEDGSTYTYTVRVNGTDQLERYAPNGMPWNYVVKEIIPKDSPYQSTDGKKEQTVTGTTGTNGVITMKPLVNTTKTKVAYSKTWVDGDGNSLKTDYAGMGKLTVNFVLQVKEEGGTTWQNASEYFNNQAELSAVDMTPSITGALTSDAWGKAYWIENLPDFVLDAQNNVKKLSYRVAETSVSQSGSTLVSWNIVERTEGDGYTLVGNNSSGATSFIEPYYPNGGYKLNANNDHYNQLKLTGLTVTKKWENDRNNLWATRKPTTRPGYQWELKLKIQRKTDEDISWFDVKCYNSSGAEDGDLTLTLYGTNQDVTVSATIKNLPAYDKAGRQYAYRAVELDGSDDLTPVDGTAGNDTYRRTYQVTADSERTTLTNTLQTVQIAAEKFWAANDFIGKKVTLQLKYQGVDGHAHAIGTLSGAKVTLDGTVDAVPTNDSTQFGYENEAWKALWTVPKVLPQELYTDGAEPGTNSDGSTIYVVEELQCDGTGNAGYRQIATSKSDDNEKYLLTNGKQMKLSIQKKWLTAAKAERKDVVIQIYRIAGSTTIPEKDIGAESLGTITLTGNTSSTLWSWSGYGFTNENGEWKSFDKYQYDPATGTSKKYLYYAREISIGGVAIGTDGKVTAGGYRYLAENPVSEIVSDSSDPDAATVMFINRQLTDIKVTKIWVDHENAYTTRPEFPDSADKPDPLKLELWRKDKTTGADWEMVSAKPTVTWNPSDKNQWIYTWTDLPYYSVGSGETYSYEVRETIPKVNDAARGQAKGSSYSSGGKTTGEIVSSGIWNGSASITNTLTGKIEITGKKVWKDENRATRPLDISLILYRWPETSSEEHKELVTTSNVPDRILTWDKTTDPDQWTYKYEKLPQFDNHGVLYVYKVVEEVTPAYRTEYHDALGREIHNLRLVTLKVQKKWEAEIAAQKEITVGIYRTTDLTIPADSSKDGTGSSKFIGQVTLNSGNNWEWSGDSLHGTPFDQRTYGEVEEKPYLYYARELRIGSTGVPAGKAGRLVEAEGYRYAVKEEMTPSALTADQAVPDSMTTVITNTQLTDLTVVKNWIDNNNQYSTRPNTPDDLKLTLYRKAEGDTYFTKLTDAVTVEKIAGTGTEANQWTYTWKNLPATDQNGKSYTYYVWETVPAINSGSTPHGAAYGGRQYVCSQGTDPAYPTEIRKDADTGKTNISRHAGLTNALTAHGISLSGTKHWADGAVDRPDTLGLKLWQSLDGENTETEISYEPETAESTANPQLLWSKSGNTWTYTFINLDGYDARGVRYHYRIEEIVPDGYRNVVLADTDASGLEDLVNIRQVQFQVEKKWRVREDSVKHPVHMKLYRTTDGQIPENSAGDAASEFLGEVSLEEANGWKWSGDQIADANGNPIYFDKYRVLDEHGQLLSAPEQYLYYAREIVTDTGFLVTEAASLATASNAAAVVTNQQLTDLTVVKEWLDHGNAYKTRPDHLELILYRQTEGGHREKITDRSPEVKKSAGNQWVYTWKDMPVQDVDGNPYTYEVEEQAPMVAEGARLLDASYVCLENQPVKLTNDQGKLTNYLKKETDLVGRKTWNDGKYAGRPATVQLHLYRQADGESTWEEVTGAMPVWYRNSDDTWSFVYEKISRTNGSGAEYRYKVEEEVPEDYRVYYSKDSDGNQVLLENVGDGSLTLTKEVTGSGGELSREFHFTITVGTLPDGSRLPDGVYGGVSFRDGKAEITLKSGESVRADHLPGMVSYTVTEEEANLDRYRTTSEADQGVIQPFAVTEVKFTNSRTSDDKDRPVKPFPANTTTTGSGPGALPGPAQTEQAADDQSKKPENHIGLWVIPKTGDETPILKDILILAAAVVVLAVLLIFRKKKKK